jgi:hypothetical protein
LQPIQFHGFEVALNVKSCPAHFFQTAWPEKIATANGWAVGRAPSRAPGQTYRAAKVFSRFNFSLRGARWLLHCNLDFFPPIAADFFILTQKLF